MANGLNVWASGPFSPIVICSDARTPDPSGQGYPAGNVQGQFGWDVGLSFGNTTELADKLAQAVAAANGKKIDRLAITVHGAPGHVDMDGKIGTGGLSSGSGSMTGQQVADELDAKTFCMKTFDSYAPAWKRAASSLNPGATVLFMSCNFGQQAIGGDMLKKISKDLLPGVAIVGFINIGIAPGRISVNKCMLPGMKITNTTIAAGSEAEEARQQLLVQGDPWASESSPKAKVALNGSLTKNPEGMTAQKGLDGDWLGATGDVQFFVHFDAAAGTTAGTVYWSSFKGAPRHNGTWALAGSQLTFEFQDDPPGWIRKWTSTLDLTDGEFRSYVFKGGVTINGAQHGYFTFSKSS